MTEDDTYLALKRIPRSQLEEKYPGMCRMTKDHAVTLLDEELIEQRELKRFHQWEKFSFILGAPEMITIHSATPISVLKVMFNGDLKGTGWTVEDYAELIRKEYIEFLVKQAQKKKQKRKLFLACCLTSSACSALITPFLPAVLFKIAIPVLLGIGGGQVFINLSRTKYPDESF